MSDQRKQMLQIARIALNDLHRRSGADLLTCHFRNPYSGNFWILEKSDGFNYDYALAGPLTLRQQQQRMIAEHDPTKNFDYFEEVPESLAGNILAAPSFVHREKVKHSIRIWITDDGSSDKEPIVVVFVNYRSKERFPARKDFDRTLHDRFAVLKAVLRPLAYESRLDPMNAWRTRSIVADLHREIAQPLEDFSKLTELYQRLVRLTYELIQPLGETKNVICTLHRVNLNNKVESVAHYPAEEIPSPSSGLVDYLGHSGSFYVINDIAAYRIRRNADPDDANLLDLSCPPQSKAKIACPLIVQNRVVGVLKLEADKENAYGEAHHLMLWQLAGVAAIAMRQETLRETSAVVREMEERQLYCQNEGEIYGEAITAAKRLGYRAGIWDLSKWYGDEAPRDTPPRETGYTAEVEKTGNIVVLADMRPDKLEFVDYIEGIIGESQLFEKWKTESPIRRVVPRVAEATERHVKRMLEGASVWDVVTDLALPIFDYSSNSSRKVAAVFWANTRRHRLSLLDDEVWFLSLICKYTSVALRILAEKTKRMALLGDTQNFMLVYHFGGRASDVVGYMNDSPGKTLAAQERRQLIVLNIDVRGSTALGAECKNLDKSSEYVSFISEYQDKARTIAHAFGGVFDKTMGDGVHILFNVYRSDLLPVPLMRDETEEKKAAIRCAFAIFNEFRELVYRYNESLKFGYEALIPLGAGVAFGSGFVGSFEKTVKGLDYTVMGSVANWAGKLVSQARGEYIEKNLMSNATGWKVFEGKERRKLTDLEAEGLMKICKEPGRSLLVAHPEFLDVARNSEDVYLMPKDQDMGFQPLLFVTGPR